MQFKNKICKLCCSPNFQLQNVRTFLDVQLLIFRKLSLFSKCNLINTLVNIPPHSALCSVYILYIHCIVELTCYFTVIHRVGIRLSTLWMEVCVCIKQGCITVYNVSVQPDIDYRNFQSFTSFVKLNLLSIELL